MDEPWTHTGLLECGAGRLRYAEAGSGPVLVLLPKLGGWIAEWQAAARDLAAHYRVIAIDPPGHGGSLMPAPPPYIQTVSESAAAIAAGLDGIGVETFSLCGVSLGGCIGIALAAFWPERVQRLALLSVSLAGRMSLAELAERDAAVMPFAFDADGFPLPRTAADFAAFGPMRPETVIAQNASRAAAGQWLRPSERGAGRFGMAAHLPRLTAPCLVVNAVESLYVKYIPVAKLLLPDAQFATIEDCGPFMHEEQPAATVAVLRGFLGSHSDIGVN
jgi:pimeloyl-ACP methyl ester carboxylesterase